MTLLIHVSTPYMQIFKMYHQYFIQILVYLSRCWLRCLWRWRNSVETCTYSV